jgi:hypothetical protein
MVNAIQGQLVVRSCQSSACHLLDGGLQRIHAPSIARPRALRTWEQDPESRVACFATEFRMTGIFERLRHSQFADPNWQAVFFAILLLLISITLVLIITTT